MNRPEKTPEMLTRCHAALQRNELFSRLQEPQRAQVVDKAGVLEAFEPGELVVKAGDPSDCLFVVVEGEMAVVVGEGEDTIDLATLGAGQLVGEMGVLLEEHRTASVVARQPAIILKFSRDVFRKILTAIPEASLGLMRLLAERLKKSSRPPAARDYGPEAPIPPVEVLRLIPLAFMQRHRVAAVRSQGNKLWLGYCDVLESTMLSAVGQMLPSFRVEPVGIDPAYFSKIMQNYAGDVPGQTEAGEAGSGASHINDFLSRLVAEGGSDLHLAAGQKPRWRIDGEIREITGFGTIGPREVLQLLSPLMRRESLERFERQNDEDFAYAMDQNSRFRINLLRDHHGVSAVFRHIPNTIFSLEQLGMPDIVRRFCEFPKGLVLVTGPTGSGKSTTLAAMIDHLNRTSKGHILTIEDPIEFVHPSKSCLVNQREVGAHTTTFARALKAALREDPDIVLIGEMRDLETISMALETANTGHLVLATLHTSTAMSTIDRIVDQFPAGSQSQIRSVLADNLLGVVCQTLCRKIGGGRVAALEILVMDYAMGHMIREGKTHLLASSMITGQGRGNRLLNDDLARLVTQKKITPEEAVANSCDKRELEKKLGLKPSL